jgi:uncharacterized protein (DUF2141 family)
MTRLSKRSPAGAILSNSIRTRRGRKTPKLRPEGKSNRMKLRRFALALAIAIVMIVGITSGAGIAHSQPPAPQPDEIRIVVNGVRNPKGSVICSLWATSNSSDFTTVGKEFRKVSAPIENGKAVCEFKGLAAGGYAATEFHDENGNGKFDRVLGYPMEGYGFTNNVYPTLRAPSFKECEVQYSGKGVLTLSINMIYR